MSERPRELRRRVMLRTRLRAISGWTDACILNVSSRGLMINAPSASAFEGSRVELWHGDRLIVATVVWRKGTRAGLRAEDRLPVDEILALGKPSSLQLTASGWPDIEPRIKPRDRDDKRRAARIIEFAALAMAGALLSTGAFMMVQHAFAHPMMYIRNALGG